MHHGLSLLPDVSHHFHAGGPLQGDRGAPGAEEAKAPVPETRFLLWKRPQGLWAT